MSKKQKREQARAARENIQQSLRNVRMEVGNQLGVDFNVNNQNNLSAQQASKKKQLFKDMHDYEDSDPRKK